MGTNGGCDSSGNVKCYAVADYRYLFDGCCRGKAKPMRAAGDMSHAKCLSECKKESKCIALETSGWKKKSGQYGSCYLFGRNPDSRQKEITNGGCDSSGNTKCYGKIDEKDCIVVNVGDSGRNPKTVSEKLDINVHPPSIKTIG